MADSCGHPRVQGSHCPDCGACVHDIVINGACHFCGATDIEVTVKSAEPGLVPASALVRDRDDG